MLITPMLIPLLTLLPRSDALRRNASPDALRRTSASNSDLTLKLMRIGRDSLAPIFISEPFLLFQRAPGCCQLTGRVNR